MSDLDMASALGIRQVAGQVSAMRDLLSHFTQIRKSGTGWVCRCPAHDDNRASLSISRGDMQPWVLTCHAGCSTDAILAAAGLTIDDISKPRSNDGRKAIVATYDYTDEQGTPLYQVCRMAPKDFRQRRPNDQGWTWKLGDVRRVLYRLKDVQGKTSVYVVEGATTDLQQAAAVKIGAVLHG